MPVVAIEVRVQKDSNYHPRHERGEARIMLDAPNSSIDAIQWGETLKKLIDTAFLDLDKQGEEDEE